MNIDKGVRNLFLGETAAVVSMTALALVTHRTTEQAAFACMVGIFVGLTAGIIIGWCWGYGWKNRPKKEEDHGS